MSGSVDRSLLAKHIRWAEAASGPELFPYRDTVGVLTIGYGRNLDSNGITKDEAEYLLSTDISNALKDAETMHYWPELDPIRKIVVTDMIFNLGLPRFKRFERFYAAMMKQDYQLASYEMKDSKWYRQTLRRAKILVKAMQTGQWE